MSFVFRLPKRPAASLFAGRAEDGSVRKISGTEEALGLRLRLQGVGTVPSSGMP